MGVRRPLIAHETTRCLFRLAVRSGPKSLDDDPYENWFSNGGVGYAARQRYAARAECGR